MVRSRFHREKRRGIFGRIRLHAHGAVCNMQQTWDKCTLGNGVSKSRAGGAMAGGLLRKGRYPFPHPLPRRIGGDKRQHSFALHLYSRNERSRAARPPCFSRLRSPLSSRGGRTLRACFHWNACIHSAVERFISKKRMVAYGATEWQSASIHRMFEGKEQVPIRIPSEQADNSPCKRCEQSAL